MRNVDLKEIGNPESAVYSKLQKHAQSLNTSLCLAVGKLLNTSKLKIKYAVNKENNPTNRAMAFEAGNRLFAVSFTDIDLNFATLLHLGAPKPERNATTVQLTNSHTHLLYRFGTTVGFLLFGNKATNTAKEVDKPTLCLELEIKIGSEKPIMALIELDQGTINCLFDEEVSKKENTDTGIPKSVFQNIPVNLNATIGKNKLPLRQISSLKKGAFIPLTDFRSNCDITANDTKIGSGELVELDNQSKGIKIL